MSKNTTNVEIWPLSRIHPYEQNAKIHDDKQVEKIAASIRKFGWRGNPIVVNEDGVILAGHGRRLAAILLNRADAPVEVVKGLSKEEQRAYRLADNRVAISNLDSEILQAELSDLDFDMEGIFDAKELKFLDADMGALNENAFVDDLDAAIDLQAEETKVTLAEADEKEVPISKALGFKAVKGKDERVVAAFMAEIEAHTGKQGAEAFVAFVTDRG
jgi:ParB-like chromosome segregation protein Spo0J